MGNPGQANYVAANAYMEGFARRRRQDGRPALAVGWGPITDVGVLSRSEVLQSRFQKVMGVRGMRAAEALDLMAQALFEGGRRCGLTPVLLNPQWRFIRGYFLRLGFLDGREGFLLAVANAEGTYYRYMKAWLGARRDG